MADINHPTTPDELLDTLKFYRAPMHLRFFQIRKVEEYLAEFGEPPEKYVEPIKRLVFGDDYKEGR